MVTTRVVTGVVQDASGTPRSAVKVQAVLSQAADITGSAEITAAPVTTTTGADGSYQLSLYANADLSPAGTYYTVTEDPGSPTPAIFTIIVPNSAGPFLISTILASPPVASPPG